VLSARRLEDIARRLDAIPHVRVLRVHTRVPVAAPERIDDALVAALRTSGKAVYVAVHCNHPAELTREVIAACARLADAGFGLLSQSVLLKGVNDSVETLAELMRALVAARIKPYYLHHLDLAPGTSHFRVPVAEGQALMRVLRTRVSGIALPTYVLDIPGGFGKVPIGPAYLAPAIDGVAQDSYAVEDRMGARHIYPPVPE
jgi:lysine 2,3-aminomutase